jgi:hypothetical protein
VPAIIDDIGNILHEDCHGLKPLYIIYVSEVQIAARVLLEGIRMVVDFTKFRPANTRESLTGRTADKNVDCLLWTTPGCRFFNQFFGFNMGDVL